MGRADPTTQAAKKKGKGSKAQPTAPAPVPVPAPASDTKPTLSPSTSTGSSASSTNPVPERTKLQDWYADPSITTWPPLPIPFDNSPVMTDHQDDNRPPAYKDSGPWFTDAELDCNPVQVEIDPKTGFEVGYVPLLPLPSVTRRAVYDHLMRLPRHLRERNLLSSIMYKICCDVLADENSTIKTPGFREWVRGTYTLEEFHGERVLTQQGQPVPVRETIHEVLCFAHLDTDHGGRDKTVRKVKNFYTGIPKQVTTSFLEACPKCDIVTLVVDLPKEPEYDPADPGALDRWRAANAKNVERLATECDERLARGEKVSIESVGAMALRAGFYEPRRTLADTRREMEAYGLSKEMSIAISKPAEKKKPKKKGNGNKKKKGKQVKEEPEDEPFYEDDISDDDSPIRKSNRPIQQQDALQPAAAAMPAYPPWVKLEPTYSPWQQAQLPTFPPFQPGFPGQHTQLLEAFNPQMVMSPMSMHSVVPTPRMPASMPMSQSVSTSAMSSAFGSMTHGMPVGTSIPHMAMSPMSSLAANPHMAATMSPMTSMVPTPRIPASIGMTQSVSTSALHDVTNGKAYKMPPMPHRASYPLYPDNSYSHMTPMGSTMMNPFNSTGSARLRHSESDISMTSTGHWSNANYTFSPLQSKLDTPLMTQGSGYMGANDHNALDIELRGNELPPQFQDPFARAAQMTPLHHAMPLGIGAYADGRGRDFAEMNRMSPDMGSMQNEAGPSGSDHHDHDRGADIEGLPSAGYAESLDLRMIGDMSNDDPMNGGEDAYGDPTCGRA